MIIDIEQNRSLSPHCYYTSLFNLSPISGGESPSSSCGRRDPKKLRKCTFQGCDKSFTKSDHLKTHLRTHTGERPYKCDYEQCCKVFADSANLKRHKRIHTGERPFRCTVVGCGKQFSVSSNLKQHLRIHTGEKPYRCEACGKTFSHVSSKRKHLKQHCSTAFQVNPNTLKAVESLRYLAKKHIRNPSPVTGATSRGFISNKVSVMDGKHEQTPTNNYQIEELKRVQLGGLQLTLAMEMAYKMAALAVLLSGQSASFTAL